MLRFWRPKGAKGVGGVRERAAGNTWLQPCPPSDLSPSPLCRVIKGKTIFSYYFIKHHGCLFIAVSSGSYSIPAVVVCTVPDWTEKAHWSSFRWNMELTKSVTPLPPPHTHKHTHTQRESVCVCVLDKWLNVFLSNAMYLFSSPECVVSGYKCNLYATSSLHRPSVDS